MYPQEIYKEGMNKREENKGIRKYYGETWEGEKKNMLCWLLEN